MTKPGTGVWAVAFLLGVLSTAACGAEGEEETEGSATVAEGSPAGVLPLETFLTNIADPSGKRHVRVQVKLVVSPEEMLEELQGDVLLMARLHDRVLTLLSTKNGEDLTIPSGKETFRSQVRDELNSLLPKGQVKEVLFSDFVVE